MLLVVYLDGNGERVAVEANGLVGMRFIDEYVMFTDKNDFSKDYKVRRDALVRIEAM